MTQPEERPQTPLQLVLRALWLTFLVFAILACAEQADMMHRYMRL